MIGINHWVDRFMGHLLKPFSFHASTDLFWAVILLEPVFDVGYGRGPNTHEFVFGLFSSLLHLKLCAIGQIICSIEAISS
jgi:hypothetical protein